MKLTTWRAVLTIAAVVAAGVAVFEGVAPLEAIRVDDLESRLATAQAGRPELQRLLTDLLKPTSAGTKNDES